MMKLINWLDHANIRNGKLTNPSIGSCDDCKICLFHHVAVETIVTSNR